MEYQLLVSAALCGALADLWSFCIGDPNLHDEPRDGRIASRLGRWLSERFQRFKDDTQRMREQRINDAIWANGEDADPVSHDDPSVKRAYRFDRVNWWKITGLCPLCTAIWLSIVVMVAHVIVAGLSPLWLCWWPLYAGVTNVALSLAQYLREG